MVAGALADEDDLFLLLVEGADFELEVTALRLVLLLVGSRVGVEHLVVGVERKDGADIGLHRIRGSLRDGRIGLEGGGHLLVGELERIGDAGVGGTGEVIQGPAVLLGHQGGADVLQEVGHTGGGGLVEHVGLQLLAGREDDEGDEGKNGNEFQFTHGSSSYRISTVLRSTFPATTSPIRRLMMSRSSSMSMFQESCM